MYACIILFIFALRHEHMYIYRQLAADIWYLLNILDLSSIFYVIFLTDIPFTTVDI